MSMSTLCRVRFPFVVAFNQLPRASVNNNNNPNSLAKNINIASSAAMGAFQSSSSTQHQSSSETSMGPVAQLVQATIAGHKVVIFSKTYCPYCDLAKKQFAKLMYNDAFTLELDQRDDGPEIQGFLKTITGSSTVPQVFIDGDFVGGGTDVQKLHDTGRLKGML